MSKKSKRESPQERAERRVARAREKLAAAREIYTEEHARGQHEIEQAREKAARWLARATERIERREAALAAAQAEAAALGVEGMVTSEPTATADRLQHLQAEAGEAPAGDGTIVIAQSTQDIAEVRGPTDG